VITALGGAATQVRFGDGLVDVLGALSPFAVLLGVWLGKRWESRTSTDAWLRDRRLATYTRFIADVGELHDGVNAVSRDTTPEDDRSTDLDRAYRAMSNTRHEIALLGPQEVSDAAGATLAQLTNLVEVFETDAAPDRTGTAPSQLREASDAALQAKHTFIAVAQKGLVEAGRGGRNSGVSGA
jgi:hypothetical protein